MLNEDYKDMLLALSARRAEFLLIGAFAMAAHGYLRATSDMDIWILPSPENADAVLKAVSDFGAPLESLTKEDLMEEGTVFQIGVSPRRIDVLTSASGLEFKRTYERSIPVTVEGIEVRVPSIGDLITNKKATGWTRDLADAEVLESLQRS